MFLRKAMRYYRLWIYSANVAILLGAIIFILAALYVGSDYRIQLLVRSPLGRPEAQPAAAAPNGSEWRSGSAANASDPLHDIYISAGDPSLVLAYLAIVVQTGLLQALGCLGAVRMKVRLIQAFWYLILALTLFDLIFVGYWARRSELIRDELAAHLSRRLEREYGFRPAQPVAALNSQHDKKLDKILTEIIDKIQTDSHCCGIAAPSDYRHTRWRGRKEAELLRDAHLVELWAARKWAGTSSLADLIGQAPLLPASCCAWTAAAHSAAPAPRDDAERERPARVPAWSPSMVVEELRPSGAAMADAAQGEDGEEARQQAAAEELHASAARRRLLAKEANYRKPAGAGVGARRRRWSVESRVDSQGLVMTRTVPGDGTLRARRDRGAARNPAALRRLLLRNHTGPVDSSNFRWPNKLSLSLDEFRIIDGYLAGGSRGGGPPPARSRRHYEQARAPDDDGQLEEERQFRLALAHRIRADSELGCAPGSYLDRASIHTGGCLPRIRTWLASAGDLLFVTGICVLSMLKLCSLLLLRLEIREMIHKIRVLKGMATEYNALQELEAYLPRPSLCPAPAAPPSALLPLLGAGALPAPVADAPACSATAPQTQPQPQPPSARAASPPPASLFPARRLAGSFSEAVAAAKQQQQQQQLSAVSAHVSGASSTSVNQQQQQLLAASQRANSMKAVAAAAAAGMLSPAASLSQHRSSSAHLHHLAAAAFAASGGGPGACCAQSLSPADLFGGGVSPISRRHTAVSVCPAAAAAVAAAAAHHLMSRRGTYVPNPAFPLARAEPLSATPATAGLGPHRHSAHTVPTLAGLRAHTAHSPAAQGPHPSGADSAATPSRLGVAAAAPQVPAPVASASASQRQLLSLVYPFKRQSSGGAQSAGNFSLDSGSVPALESRRSIH